MPRNLFSRSSTKKSRSPSLPEQVSSPTQPQSNPPSPLDNTSLSNVDDNSLELPLPRWSSPSPMPTSDISSLPEKKSAWHSIHSMMSSNRLSTQGSTGACNASLERSSTPSTVTDPPPSSPTADSSTTRSCEPGSKNKFRLPSYRREGKPSEPAHVIKAIEGETIASRHKIGTASIDCEFYKIEYGQFKERPACLIIVDVRLVYPPDNTIDKAKLEFRFGTDGLQNLSPEDHHFTQNAKAPISKVFAPEMIEGMPSNSQKTTHHNIKPKIQGLGFKIDTAEGGGQTTITNTHRWRVQGRREEHNGIYDTFGWNIFQNAVSEDSVPRQVRLGMIAFHQHEPFWVNVNILGGTREKRWLQKATQEKRWFNPPDSEDVGRHILQEAMVENLVSRQNLLIRDIAQSRVMEGKTVNLIDIGEISGGAGSGIDGGGLITDLLSIGDFTGDTPTTMMDSTML